MASNPPEDRAFLREVDEEYRRDQLTRFWLRWGRWIAIGLVIALIAFAAWLYLDHRSARTAELQGESYDAALADLSENKRDTAEPALSRLRETGNPGYSAMARFSEANLLLADDDLKGAAEKFGAIAADTSVPAPMRELAVIRQTLAEYDSLEPTIVIDRLKALAVPDNAYFGTAGEMVAAAYLKQGKRQEAGELYGQIAQSETVPTTVRQRAVQMAGVLGVDAVAEESEAAGEASPANATEQDEEAQTK